MIWIFRASHAAEDNTFDGTNDLGYSDSSIYLLAFGLLIAVEKYANGGLCDNCFVILVVVPHVILDLIVILSSFLPAGIDPCRLFDFERRNCKTAGARALIARHQGDALAVGPERPTPRQGSPAWGFFAGVGKIVDSFPDLRQRHQPRCIGLTRSRHRSC